MNTVHPATTKPWMLKTNCSEFYTFCEENSNLTTVPINIPSRAKIINLSNNSIHVLNNNSFSGLANVKTIDLSENIIQTVYNNSFAGLTNLTNLILRNNNLSSLPKCLFKDQNLRYLDVAFNNLKTIHPDLWHCLKSLKTLKITGNPVVEVTPGAFLPLNNLSRLYVDLPILENFHRPILISLSRKDTKIVAEDVNYLPCNSSSCYLKELEDKGYMDHYTFNGRHSKPVCSNRPEKYWHQMKDQLNCPTKGSF